MVDVPPFDAVVVTDFGSPQAMFDDLVTKVSAERVLAPQLLHISRVRPELAE